MLIHATGQGERAVVGFHGWGGNHRTFDPLLPFLPSNTVFYSFDLPACGKSPLPEVWEMRSVARSVAQKISGLGQTKFTLAGNCSGALMALFVARELEEMGMRKRVQRLVLVDPFARCPWFFAVFLIPILGPVLYFSSMANPLGRWVLNLFLREKRTGEADLMETFSETGHAVNLNYLRMLANSGKPEQFRELQFPVELLRGEKTFVSVVESVERWQDLLPEAHIHVIEGAGHLPIEEKSAEVAKILFFGAD